MWGDGTFQSRGRLVSLDNGRARAYCAAVGRAVRIFFLSPIIFLFPPPSLWGGWIDDLILRPFQ